MSKTELRGVAKAARDAAHRGGDPDHASHQLAHQIQMNECFRKLLANTAVHASYRPIKSEISTIGFEEIWRNGLALPCVTKPDHPLTFRRWSPGEPTVRGAFDIEEPDASAEVVRPDVMLVPLLAFDQRGYRLGYGGGFYDRTIAAFKRAGHTCWTLGLAYDAQEVEKVPTEPTDMALDAIATPTRLIVTTRSENRSGSRLPCA